MGPGQAARASAVPLFGSHAATAYPEYLEKLVVEGLRVAALVMSVLPFLGKGARSCPYLVPAKTHFPPTTNIAPFYPRIGRVTGKR